ncbi:hypothetical protein [Streptomyces sp. MAR4 CNX-425]|uniref:hypothetical protein n=1 Tax=Streptomyces sp. MAR4 CNX-425 TaxID=3406343 RepID=UPI003B5134D5
MALTRRRPGRRRRRPLGRAERAILAVLAVAAVAAVAVVLVLRLGGDGPCGDGLVESADGEECVGVADATAGSPAFEPGADGPDERIADLVRKIAEENEKVGELWEGRQEPYVRVAVLLPFNASESSAMTPEVVQNSLAGVLTAQLHANRDHGLNYQLLLSNIGRDLSQWRPAVEALDALTVHEAPTEEDSPLVGVIGLPNSEKDTEDAAVALARADIPAVSGVLSSPEISADTLFKAAPSNTESVAALSGYLDENPGAHPGEPSGFLVWDSREEDGYVANTRENMRRVFGEEYGLENRQASFVGRMGDYAGAPRRFSPAARGICRLEADTVFYAGRDSDLPYLITQLSDEPDCDDFDAEIRILRVATGLPEGLTDRRVREDMAEARVVTVGASATDAPSWRAGEGSGERFATFAEGFGKASGLPGEALNDGYAIMHHDAFVVVSRATDTALTDLEESAGGGGSNRLPSKLDVYNTITNMRVVRGPDGCHDCVPGASGQFGFDVEKDNWPVCKPVPIIEYPRPEGADRPRLYRTFQGPNGKCPA